LLEVLLSESLLGAGDQRPDGRGIQAQRGGQFVIRQTAGSQNEQFRLAIPEHGQDLADLFALLGGGVGLLGRR
jgi:hypothetical protein